MVAVFASIGSPLELSVLWNGEAKIGLRLSAITLIRVQPEDNTSCHRSRPNTSSTRWRMHYVHKELTKTHGVTVVTKPTLYALWHLQVFRSTKHSHHLRSMKRFVWVQVKSRCSVCLRQTWNVCCFTCWNVCFWRCLKILTDFQNK